MSGCAGCVGYTVSDLRKCRDTLADTVSVSGRAAGGCIRFPQDTVGNTADLGKRKSCKNLTGQLMSTSDDNPGILGGMLDGHGNGQTERMRARRVKAARTGTRRFGLARGNSYTTAAFRHGRVERRIGGAAWHAEHMSVVTVPMVLRRDGRPGSGPAGMPSRGQEQGRRPERGGHHPGQQHRLKHQALPRPCPARGPLS